MNELRPDWIRKEDTITYPWKGISVGKLDKDGYRIELSRVEVSITLKRIH